MYFVTTSPGLPYIAQAYRLCSKSNMQTNRFHQSHTFSPDHTEDAQRKYIFSFINETENYQTKLNKITAAQVRKTLKLQSRSFNPGFLEKTGVVGLLTQFSGAPFTIFGELQTLGIRGTRKHTQQFTITNGHLSRKFITDIAFLNIFWYRP